MLTSALVFAVASAFALFILLVKLNIRRILGYDVAVDIACTVVLLSAMEGTATGMGAAMIAAVVISLFLFVIKLCIGYERLKIVDGHLQWVSYKPVWIDKLKERAHSFHTHSTHNFWQREK